MPSIVGHFAVPVALCTARRVPGRLLVAGLAASMLPDADTLGLLAGVAQHGAAGHRGWTHSIVFAFAVATMLGAMHARGLRPSRGDASTPGDGRAGAPRAIPFGSAFPFLLACALSHPLLDVLTNGGPGVMLGWPFTDARVFAPWRPIEVSPIGAGFFSARGLTVVASELLWVVAPAFVLALAARGRVGRRP